MRYLIIALITLVGCSLNPDMVVNDAVINVKLVDGYIRDCDDVRLATGCARKQGNFYQIEVSNESPSHQATLEHEFKHVYRWLTGDTPEWIGH